MGQQWSWNAPPPVTEPEPEPDPLLPAITRLTEALLTPPAPPVTPSLVVREPLDVAGLASALGESLSSSVSQALGQVMRQAMVELLANMPRTDPIQITEALANLADSVARSEKSSRLIAATGGGGGITGTVSVSNPTDVSALAKDATLTGGSAKTQVTNFPATQNVALVQTGTYTPYANTSGTVNVPSGAKILSVAATATTAATFTFLGVTFQVPANNQVQLSPVNVVGPQTLVFTGTSGYVVETTQ